MVGCALARVVAHRRPRSRCRRTNDRTKRSGVDPEPDPGEGQMTTVTTTDRPDDTPRNTSSGRRTRSVRTIIGASVAAVVAFAPMSGVVDAAPSALLQQEGDNTDRSETAAAPPVELGDRNELAAWWQDRLNEWLQLSGSELYPIVVDGWYGPNTQQATIAFQEATASVEADGVVNPQDRIALREAIDALVGETGDGTDDGAVGFDTDIATSSNLSCSEARPAATD